MSAMDNERDAVKASFDLIAALDQEAWDHNSHYHGILSGYLPEHSLMALDIGCGTGVFTRILASRTDKVLAIDFSGEMVRRARERSTTFPNIEFVETDFLEYPLADESLDCVASIATFHHLPFDAACRKVSAALKPGGVFILLDLYQPRTPSDHFFSLLGVPVNHFLRVVKRGKILESEELRAAWREHALYDHLNTLDEIVRLCNGVLPGASIRRHVLWRYSLFWKKPSISYLKS